MFHSDSGQSIIVRVRRISIGPSRAIEMDKAPWYGSRVVETKSVIRRVDFPGHLLSQGRLPPCAVSAALRGGRGTDLRWSTRKAR